MTPDPITTAREALTRLAHDEYVKSEDRRIVTAALDYAEKLQSALSVTQEEGRTEIARLEAEVEKLKGDLAVSERSLSQWQRLASENKDLVMSGRAEIEKLKSEVFFGFYEGQYPSFVQGYEKGVHELSSPVIAEECAHYVAQIKALTSQLEQAERVIAPFAEAAKAFAPVISDSDWCPIDFVCGKDMAEITVQVLSFRAASQWIKDRQAKGEG